jgi:hypothetical protein
VMVGRETLVLGLPCLLTLMVWGLSKAQGAKLGRNPG